MTPIEIELEHLIRLATRQSWDTDHSHKEWKRLVWDKANAMESECPALYAGLAAALTARMSKSSNASGPNQSCTNE